MAHSISWIGVRGLGLAEILARLELLDTGIPDDDCSASFALAELKNGWSVLRCEDFDFPTPKRLAGLSRGVEAISGQIEEHVMVSIGRGFRDGRQIWSVVHDPDKGLYSLVIEGDPPQELSSISARLSKKQDSAGGEQADVDFVFDVVPELVCKICGYRPDQGKPPAFKELVPVPRSLVKVLAGMFGRR